MESKSSTSLSEIRDAMRERVPQRVGMGRKNVFMTTEYGDVVITDKYVLFPGNPYKFARRRKSLADYCDFIIGGIGLYSSPDVRIKKVLEEMSGHRYSITAIKVLDIQTEHGRVLVDGGHVRYPGNPECFSRGPMTLQEWCAFVLNGIDKYPGRREDIKFHKTDVVEYQRSLSGFHLKWVGLVKALSLLSIEDGIKVLIGWTELLRNIVLEYSKMFGADIKDVEFEKMKRGVSKHKKTDKTIVLDVNLVAWSSNAVIELILHQICRSFHSRYDLGFWYNLEQMCVSAGLIECQGKVEEVLYEQIKYRGEVGVNDFSCVVANGPDENMLLYNRFPEKQIDSIALFENYIKEHKRLLNLCWKSCEARCNGCFY